MIDTIMNVVGGAIVVYVVFAFLQLIYAFWKSYREDDHESD